ncbi:class I SAM-dependent methyltransferase [Chryseobacterium balustinum]|uniref:Bifunctional 3-demethylubiquinone-9 3-methyltransferase/ 2-octaprenyl-6-hydroxy phenol methylase n=1 Tax=Chryseobacterium balustinum TaxID=246 RepID=A0AAX2IN01_9FLAO|nr:class I SAM-dependent methyltransferase [Chryseobacterium balustinum]AZB28919.1 class I SAM-dependent methyltransferase [Chryseobacterium balustinum]SKB62321.1 Methyltransferase domain-containing protein [Chryseobacterium balustinum]SQA91255.1 bifunctional 3-demethylubiquinone-9 3-methyltransferase/ 2-octaprenyl-6-hydroxy phenol methylase [Chryseobacterium balustinum]
MENYLDINRKSWNAKVESHLKSDFYFVDEFLKGRTSLNSIELGLLGDVKDKAILHLQCHFGQDSISLSRMGAKVTGIDLSDKAIETGKDLAKQCTTDTEFICSDVYDLPNILNEKFDIVFTSYGTIGWLPDLEKWANVIDHFLRPGGQFVMAEFHPVVWMFDDDFKDIAYNYFNEKPIMETYEGTYADFSAEIVQEYVMWNHSLSEVMQSLMDKNLIIEKFQEFDWSPYPCFKNIVEFEKGKWRTEKFGNKIPMVYAISAQKKSS